MFKRTQHAEQWHLNTVLCAGDTASAEAHSNEATALLLPAALAHVQRVSRAAQLAKHNASTAQRAQHGGASDIAATQAELHNKQLSKIASDSVRVFFEGKLMAYMTARTNASQGQHNVWQRHFAQRRPLYSVLLVTPCLPTLPYLYSAFVWWWKWWWWWWWCVCMCGLPDCCVAEIRSWGACAHFLTVVWLVDEVFFDSSQRI